MSVPGSDFVIQKRRVILFHLLQNAYSKGFSSIAAPETCSLEDNAFSASFRGRICKVMQFNAQHLSMMAIPFLQDRSDLGSALSLASNPTKHTPEKELKGVTFSEVAIILDDELEKDEDEDDDVFPQ